MNVAGPPEPRRAPLEWESVVTDVVAVLVMVAVFALLALVAKGAEKL